MIEAIVLLALFVVGLSIAARAIWRALHRGPSDYQKLRDAGRRARGDVTGGEP